MSAGGGGARKKKGGHEEHEEHVNHERWLVSYADMLTLLFVLFVVLYSMSDVNMKKFAQLANGLSEGFGGQSAAFQGKQAVLEGSGNNTQIISIDPGAGSGDGKAGTSDMTAREVQAVQNALVAQSRAKASQDAKAAAKEAENMKKIENKISDALAKQKLLGQVKFTLDRRGLVVTVVTN